MNRRAVLITGAVFLLAAFLLGFVPQYIQRGEVENQLDSTREQLVVEGQKVQLDEIGLLIGDVYLETNLKNYGIAGQYATTFFDRVRAMQNQTQNSSLHTFFQAALSKRDAVIGGLAKGDPSTVGTIQDLLQQTLQVTQTAPASSVPTANR